ncbi:hypothetical protein QVD17_00274 [Tagetes erecta]|uniref:Reverse transcriptase zinc-binding domain-containing protein n=1 Tax=Tagetes erecta TaxID=13708 RepID=A0AAD8L499_TARER|nr:hypothetical protein QVD17_00274 [Tagetes erecta]
MELLQLQQCSQLLASVRPNSNQQDSWIWTRDKENSFSVKSMKQLIQSPSVVFGPTSYTWNNWLPLKINIFGWKTIRNRNPTRKEISDRDCSLKSWGTVMEHGITPVMTFGLIMQLLARKHLMLFMLAKRIKKVVLWL